jgi:rubrerythrin
MKQTPPIGDNKTGIGAAPERARDMLNAGELARPTSTGDGRNPAAVHVSYAREGLPIGCIPATGAQGEPVDEDMAPFLDKLGARLAFERTGTRLYEGLLAKHEAYGSYDGGPSRDELVEIREQELEHFLLLRRAILELGGDPTAVTPSADLESNAGKGVGDVIGDPRTTLLEGLEAIVIAELADHESWEGLIELADGLGQQGLAEHFQAALVTEETHLEKVRRWIAAGQGRRPTHH